MRLPRRRLRVSRRLGKPGLASDPRGSHSAVPSSNDGPAPARSPEAERRAQESTVELVAVPEEIPAPPARHPGLREVPPPPPRKIEFTCVCGTGLIATPETYDKQSRCAECRAVLLLNLVYDPDCRSYEIVAFPAPRP
jgi:hypothetical protein